MFACLKMERLCCRAFSTGLVYKAFCRSYTTYLIGTRIPIHCHSNQTRTYLHITRDIHRTIAKHNYQDPPRPLDTFLQYAILGSMVLGATLMSYIGYDYFKRRGLQKEGITAIHRTETGGMKLYEYKNYVLPDIVCNVMKDVKTFETSEDDIWVVSYPRSGTTWLQELVYLIHSDMDLETASSKHLDERWSYIEFVYPGIKTISTMPAPRLIKSHLPHSLLPDSVHEKKPKIIYIARNPKDVLVSYYYFCRLLFPVSRFKGDFPTFFNLFMKDRVPYSPWSSHVQEFWERRNEPNILYITYEELKKDTHGTIDRIAAFLGKKVSKEEKQQIVEHCSFQRMKDNPKTNYSWLDELGITNPKEGEVLRKGAIGDWMNHLTPIMNAQIAEMLQKRLGQTDISFTYIGSTETSTDK